MQCHSNDAEASHQQKDASSSSSIVCRRLSLSSFIVVLGPRPPRPRLVVVIVIVVRRCPLSVVHCLSSAAVATATVATATVAAIMLAGACPQEPNKHRKADFWTGDPTKHSSVKKKGFSVKRGEGFSERGGLVRISTGRAI